MAAGEIVVSLLMKTGSFLTDTQRAQKELAQLKKEAVAAGEAIGVAFAGVALSAAYMVKSSIDAMDEMSKLAQKVGTTTESLSALAYAADLSGLSNEELGSALVKLSRNMSEAAMGSAEARRGFDALGISVQNADGSLRDAGDVLADVADKFTGYKDSAEKTALATALFGKAGAQLIPLLNSGRDGLAELRREAEQLGVVLDTETSKRAEEFNDNLTRMHYAVKGIANAAAADLLPAMTEASGLFVGLAKNADVAKVAAEGVKGAIFALTTVLQTFAVVGSEVAYVFGTIGRSIGALMATMETLGAQGASPASVMVNMARSLAGGGLERVREINKALEEENAKALDFATRFQRTILGLTNAGGNSDQAFLRGAGYGSGTPTPKGGAPRMTGGDGAAKQSEFEKYLDGLQRQLEKVQDLTAAEQVLTDLRSGRVGDTSPEQEKILLDLAERITLTKEAKKALEDLAKFEAKEAADEEARLRAIVVAEQARLDALLNQGPDAQLQKQRDDMVFLAEAFERGTISAQQYTDAVTGVLKLNADIKEQKSLVEELGLTFTSAFEDAIVAGKKFSDVLQGLAQDILRIVVRRNITEPLGQALTGSDLFSGIGDFFSGLFGGARAAGGPVAAGSTYLVGEQGPELFVPSSSGSIVPNSMLGGGGGLVVNVQNNVPNAQITARERNEGGVRQLEIAVDQIDQALAQRVARGQGALTGAMQSRWSLGMARG